MAARRSRGPLVRALRSARWQVLVLVIVCACSSSGDPTTSTTSTVSPTSGTEATTTTAPENRIGSLSLPPSHRDLWNQRGLEYPVVVMLHGWGWFGGSPRPCRRRHSMAGGGIVVSFTFERGFGYRRVSRRSLRHPFAFAGIAIHDVPEPVTVVPTRLRPLGSVVACRRRLRTGLQVGKRSAGHGLCAAPGLTTLSESLCTDLRKQAGGDPPMESGSPLPLDEIPASDALIHGTEEICNRSIKRTLVGFLEESGSMSI